MYLCDNTLEDLDLLKLGKVLQSFQTLELPQLSKYKNYYDGKQAIMQKLPTDDGKPCNRIVVNYCKSIVDNYAGYLSGIPIGYEVDERILDVLAYNDVKTEDTELLRQALIYGIAFEINYIDEDSKQRFKALDSRQCIPIYGNTLDRNLKFVVRFYQEDLINSESYIVEVYGAAATKVYRSTVGFTSFNLVEERPNYFNQVPITVFSLNADNASIFAPVLTLQDGYNTLLSAEIDDFESFCDAYLVLKGMTADAEDLKAMKESRCLMLDSDDADAAYLTKNISDTQIQNILKNINNQIYNKANCLDFNDENFQASTGIALKLKLVGFENAAAIIEGNMRQAIQKRIELICSILSLTGGDAAWRDIDLTFTRNLPTNLEDISNVVNNLRGLVSTRTLLSLLPFVKDVDEELKLLEAEQATALSMYNFGDKEE